MAPGRSIRAGQAYVELYGDDTRLQRTLRSAQRNLRRFGGSARMIGGGVFAAVAASVAPISAISLRAASDANEIRNRFNQVFREQAEQAGDFADKLGDQVGRSGTKLRETLSNYMAFFVGLGFGRDEARQLSQEMTSLGIDFASFNNLSDAEASGRFISALSGSSEVVDRFGINLKAAALELELQNLGLAKNTQSADELSKAVARYSIISRALTQQGALGDAVRTSGEFANQQRRAKDELFDLAAAMGTAIIPAATELLIVTNGIIGGFTEWIGVNGDLVFGLVKSAGVIAIVAGGVFALGLAAAILANPIGLAALAAGGLVLALQQTGAATGVIEFLAATFSDTAEAASLAADAIIAAFTSGRLDLAWDAAAAGLALAFFETIDEITSYFAGTFGTLLGVDAFVAGATAGLRARLQLIRAELDIESPDVIGNDGSQFGFGGGERMRSATPSIGSLRGESAINLLAGAGPDRVAKDVKSIKDHAEQIAANTAEMGRYA